MLPTNEQVNGINTILLYSNRGEAVSLKNPDIFTRNGRTKDIIY